jgi:hypothetical protein
MIWKNITLMEIEGVDHQQGGLPYFMARKEVLAGIKVGGIISTRLLPRVRREAVLLEPSFKNLTYLQHGWKKSAKEGMLFGSWCINLLVLAIAEVVVRVALRKYEIVSIGNRVLF